MKKISIIDAIQDENIFKSYFDDLATWKNWMVVERTLFGLELSKEEMKVFRKCTKLRKQPGERIRELWIRSGRRSGKSRMIAVTAAYLGLFVDWSKHISKGEKPFIFVVSPNKVG